VGAARDQEGEVRPVATLQAAGAPLSRLRVVLFVCGLLLSLPVAPAIAQEEPANNDILQEYRITAYPFYKISERWNGFGYLGYVYKPDARYTSYYLGKGVFWQPKKWLQVWGGLIGVYTNMYDASNTLELRPFGGPKFLGQTSKKWHYYNWTRYELRLVETLNTDQWTTVHRFRNQTRVEIPLTSTAHAWTPKTAYVLAEVEPIYRSDNDNIDPLRLRVGLGYIASPRVGIEFQYFAQYTRPGGGGLQYTDNIWRLNFKLGGRGGVERLLWGGMDE
jgi:hypothetical protein